jgi:Ca2+-transporting ATPase
MAAQRAIPRRLHAVETLGSVTVVASDKTGTLTEGRMAVRLAVDADGREYHISGRGYEPSGRLSGPRGSDVPQGLRALAQAALLCSDAALRAPSGDHRDWRAIGDPMEAALVAFAGRCGLVLDTVRAEWPRVAEQPFDPKLRRMTTVHRQADGRLLTICKGAPEVVLRPPIVLDLPADAEAAAARLAAAGLRVLAVAGTDCPATRRTATSDELDPPTGLRYLGLVGIGDPVREDAPGVAKDFADAGIRLLLITGDHPGTATAVGGDVGIWRPGDDVHHGGDGAPNADRANQVRVFARVPPEQKLDIVAALQANGHVVAMTGDGVNDAPALRRADIGVAMGSGTEVARQAADLVLVDDNLGTMATAVREGRRIYDNIRRFLHYALSGGAAELVVMLVGPFVGLPLTLLPAQILWINLLTHGIPGVALGAEPAEEDTARRPPRPPQESVLGAGLAAATVRTGLVLAAVVLGVGIVAAATGRQWQSMLFLVLGFGQLGVALAVRARRHPGGERNLWLYMAVLASGLLMLAGIFVPPLRELLGTASLPTIDVLWCLIAACVPFVLLSTTRRLGRV